MTLKNLPSTSWKNWVNLWVYNFPYCYNEIPESRWSVQNHLFDLRFWKFCGSSMHGGSWEVSRCWGKKHKRQTHFVTVLSQDLVFSPVRMAPIHSWQWGQILSIFWRPPHFTVLPHWGPILQHMNPRGHFQAIATICVIHTIIYISFKIGTYGARMTVGGAGIPGHPQQVWNRYML